MNNTPLVEFNNPNSKYERYSTVYDHYAITSKFPEYKDEFSGEIKVYNPINKFAKQFKIGQAFMDLTFNNVRGTRTRVDFELQYYDRSTQFLDETLPFTFTLPEGQFVTMEAYLKTLTDRIDMAISGQTDLINPKFSVETDEGFGYGHVIFTYDVADSVTESPTGVSGDYIVRMKFKTGESRMSYSEMIGFPFGGYGGIENSTQETEETPESGYTRYRIMFPYLPTLSPDQYMYVCSQLLTSHDSTINVSHNSSMGVHDVPYVLYRMPCSGYFNSRVYTEIGDRFNYESGKSNSPIDLVIVDEYGKRVNMQGGLFGFDISYYYTANTLP